LTFVEFVKGLGAVGMALAIACCDRASHRKAPSVEVNQRALAISQNDNAIATRRGLGGAELSFGSPGPQSPIEATLPPAGLAALGPFRLGMNLDAVRSAARRAHVASNNEFAPNGIVETAWCSPPIRKAGTGLILAPKELNFNACLGSRSCTSYTLEFEPFNSRLRLVSINDSETRSVKASGDLIRRLGRNKDDNNFSACELTSTENDRLSRWDHVEDSNLVDKLGSPDLDKNRLPSAVRATLDRWDRSVTVPCDGGDDCYSLSPAFDGDWQSGGNFVVKYTLSINGIGNRWMPYVIVVGPRGNIVWTGAEVEFEKHGLEGKQHTPREVGDGA
jgi:hypothetical protein